MSTPTVTIVGRLTADPELRFTPAGKAVVNFTVAASDRRKNQQTEQWEDGDKAFMRCSAWEQVAENVAESLLKGDEVIVVGNLVQREFTDKEGNNRSVIEVRARDIAAAITRFASVKVNKLEKASAGRTSSSWSGSNNNVPFSDEPPF